MGGKGIKMYLIRLDDASEYMHTENWGKMEKILDKNNLKPIVGIIPNNQDLDFIGQYEIDDNFWSKARKWQAKQWTIALHVYSHVCSSHYGGMNPVNAWSEFAGVSLEEQKKKIAKGVKILEEHGLDVYVFLLLVILLIKIPSPH